MTATSTAIAADQAVRHTTRRDFLVGRVHHVLGTRAVVTWVRRANKSVVQVRNLMPISEAELVATFHQQEALYDAMRNDHQCVASVDCLACVAPPATTSVENRQFLLGAAASTTRTVHFTLAPEIAAYFKRLDGQPGRVFVVDEYDLFAAGYRAALDERGLRTDPPLGEVNASGAVDEVRARVWPGRDEPQGLVNDE